MVRLRHIPRLRSDRLGPRTPPRRDRRPGVPRQGNRLEAGWAHASVRRLLYTSSKSERAPLHLRQDRLGPARRRLSIAAIRRPSPTSDASPTGRSSTSSGREQWTRERTKWYTLSENLYRAYLARATRSTATSPGSGRFRILGRVRAQGRHLRARPGGGACRLSRLQPRQHARRCRRRVRVKGEQNYLDVLEQRLRIAPREPVLRHRRLGPDEQLLPAALLGKLEGNARLRDPVRFVGGVQDRQVPDRFTGDAKYGDWVERLALNGLGASIPMTRGRPRLLLLRLQPYGGTEAEHRFGWSCCTGTRPQAVADFTDLVYFHRRTVERLVNSSRPRRCSGGVRANGTDRRAGFAPISRPPIASNARSRSRRRARGISLAWSVAGLARRPRSIRSEREAA